VAKSSGDLGMVRIDGGLSAGAWWRKLTSANAPKIIARVPFIERPDHPAGMPVFVISLPLAEAAARDVMIYSVTLDRWQESIPAQLGQVKAEILGNAATDVGLSLLLSLPGTKTEDDLRQALRKAGAANARIELVGSHAARYDHSQIKDQ
jgi:hypothetical protein